MRPGFELPPLNSLNCKQAKNCVSSKTRFAREHTSLKRSIKRQAFTYLEFRPRVLDRDPFLEFLL